MEQNHCRVVMMMMMQLVMVLVLRNSKYNFGEPLLFVCIHVSEVK